MKLGVPKEPEGETRVGIVPSSMKKLAKAGFEVLIESGAGHAANYHDADYEAAGASIVSREQALACENIVCIRFPGADGIAAGTNLACVSDPFRHPEYVKACMDANITLRSMDMIPRRLSRAQSMDVNSSQDNLAGYKAVLLGAAQVPKGIPMMTTSAGTIRPAKVVIMGSGVAGLQAIATAKRLGARVTAFDTRPVVAEQVESLGGKFLEIDLGDTGQTADGYAKELTPEQVEMQRQAQKAVIADSDVVITTAQVFGRKPPVLVTADMVEGMSPGSVIVDMAAETGGNVEGSVPDEVVNVNGVTIVGTANLANLAPRDATQMYASNMFNLVEDTWDEEGKQFVLDLENDILPGCVITHGGAIVHPTIKDIIEGGN